MIAFASRTPTPTSRPTPNSTATAVTLMMDVSTTAEAAGQTLYDLWVNPFEEAVYVYVLAGKFTMGSGDGDGDEQPVHRVALGTFWIMRSEVTDAKYDLCVRAGICTAPDNSIWRDVPYADHPVTDVGWDQSLVSAGWVNGRLPTEAEWEKACRGTDLRAYSWGDAEPTATLLNFNWNTGGTTPVGTYPTGASPYGLLDMAGNISEWIADAYSGSYYAESPEANPTGPSDNGYRTARGGHSKITPLMCVAPYASGMVSLSISTG